MTKREPAHGSLTEDGRRCGYFAALALLLGLAATALHAARALGETAAVYEGAAVITGDGAFLSQADVLVSGGSIVAVGNVADFALPPETTRIDLSGKFLMPAMIDGHCHLGYQGPRGWGGVHYSRENVIGNLRQYAYYGFAAAFSAGSDADDVAFSLTARQQDEVPDGARMLFAAGMAPPGQGPYDAFVRETELVESQTGMTVLRGVEDPDGAVREVQQVAERGYRFIKIWVDDRGGGQDKLPESVYRPLIAEAARRNIAVFAHQQAAADMPPLIDAGISGFLHGRLGPSLGKELAIAAAASGAFVIPNLGLAELRRETLGRDPFLSAVLPAAQAEGLAATTEQRRVRPSQDPARERELRASLGTLLEAGVDIVLGTDAGALPDHPFGYSGHRELEILVRLGMSPMQALVAATGNAARHFRQKDLGLIAPGRRADFLVLEKNPLEDIRNTRAIHAVYLAGERIDREAIARQLRHP